VVLLVTTSAKLTSARSIRSEFEIVPSPAKPTICPVKSLELSSTSSPVLPLLFVKVTVAVLAVQRLAAVDRHWPGGWGIIDQRPAGRILASSKAGSELPETFRLTESVPLASSHDATVIVGVHMTRYVLQILKIDMILHVFVRIFRETDDCSPEVVRIIENERGRDSYRPPGVPKVTVWPEETEPPISTVAWLKSSIDLVPVMFPAIVTTAAELLAELPASISPLFRTLSSICSVWPAGTSRMPPALFVTRRLPTGPLAVLV
jgi:hypothetical protein